MLKKEPIQTNTCTKCGSSNLKKNNSRWDGKNSVYIEVCLNCGHKWKAIFTKKESEGV